MIRRRPIGHLLATGVITTVLVALAACSSTSQLDTASAPGPTGTTPTTRATVPSTTTTTSSPGTVPGPTSTATVPDGDTIPVTTVRTDGGAMRLPLGQAVVVDADGSTLELVSIDEDSRCPEAAACVWEGELQVTVDYVGASSGPTAPARLQLTWVYHADPTATPDGRFLLGLDDLEDDAPAPTAIVTITEA